MKHSTLGRGERGSAAAELVLLAPILSAVMGFIVVSGVLWFDHQVLNDAARSAAEAAAMGPTAGAAGDAARAVARDDLVGSSLDCPALRTSLDTSTYRAGGSVSVEVRCLALLPRLPFLSVSATVPIESLASASLEPYRLLGQ